ncbi:transcriptional regulator, BadM/Rrf2 family [Rhizobium sp. RU20A]|uniref:RrF2 family transcriptional regulator n=1 Tax=Rhizobium sp. RU20A TaxID=1907412 RepID=UPI000953FFC5|nr:Rrf2 family transcriptional regulator [Rhizobium sp. RU20A]SIQ17078.1 transcriptional regulator, BadM/Rrf2 family [Rhizobium sp. RU20A]
MISQKAKYAMRALVALARVEPGTSLMIGEIAESQAIPKKFLEQILLDLKREGIVTSRRGKAGGYLMMRTPDAVSFGEVLRLIDGPLAPLPCLSKVAYHRCADCSNESACEIRHVFAKVAEATRDILDGTTLADSLTATAAGHTIPGLDA